MPQNDSLQQKLLTQLEDIYAMEHSLVEALGNQAEILDPTSIYQRKIQEHLEQTREHQDRIKACLQRYGKSPSGVKSALNTFMKPLHVAPGGMRASPLAKSVREDYVAEHFEIAAYEMLIATAMACNDHETERACQRNLHDEIVMAKWLESHLGQAALVSMQQDGMEIPPAQVDQEQAQLNSLMTQWWQEASQAAATL
jgi:ferritin-like metal-binding protein YciE